MSRGNLALVLHAHLPFVRHPEHRWHLEEHWLYEAVTATYLPLLQVFRDLADAGVPFRLTLSLSPSLTAMLADDLLKHRTAAYLDRLLRLGEAEVRRTAGDATFGSIARFYLERFRGLKGLYDQLRGDLIGAFGQLQEGGQLEIITVAGTHAFLPVVREAAARRAQIQIACETYQRHFGRWPRGIWLPECGYSEGLDQILAEFDLRYFFVDAHGLLHARPRPPMGLYAPTFCPTGVAAFGRDLESSTQVWSATEGYPGDPVYREFYRDIGFDLPLDAIGPYIHPDGIRLHTGYKYFRVSGAGVDLAHKEPYDPAAALERARVHAGNFVFNRARQVEHAATLLDRAPIVVSPYDAELFGHWWFEGPAFLDAVIRKVAFDEPSLRLATAADYLEEYPVNAVAEPGPSSWGAGGYAAVWIDGTNDWIYRHVHRAEARMRELARRFANGAGDLERRALNQAARELMLAQGSDWAFIMKNKTAVDYACARIKAHLARFRRLDQGLSESRLDPAWLADLEGRDNLFPDVDYRVFAS
jgi:1,4-alpha-glucan branching enzyme